MTGNSDGKIITKNISKSVNRQLKVTENLQTFSVKNSFAFVNDFTFYIDKPEQLQIIKKSVIVTRYVVDLLPPANIIDKLDKDLLELDKKMYIFTDNMITENYKKFLAIKIFFVPELLGPNVDETDYDFEKFSKKDKLYNCFIQRVESVRQSWLYKLYLDNLLDNGYVSFLLYQNYDCNQDLFEFNHFNFGMNNLQNFHDAYLSLKDKVPFRNFDPGDSLEELTLKSKYSLVLETYATDDNYDCIYFSEKTFRSLQLPTIDLIFCQKDGYNSLKNLSFELQDHANIDNLPWQERQNKLLNILHTDCCDTSYKDLLEKAKHNKNLLLGYNEKVISDNFFESYLDIIKK